MKTVNYLKSKGVLVAAIILSNLTMVVPTTIAQQKKTVKNIVIVHGAFADGSGWRKVHDILSAKGYNVSIVQNPLTSLKDDVEATKRIIDRQNGPVVLVGHSWGGTVITEAGNDSKVASLVYVAAHQPDQGENTIQWAETLPPLPENGILAPDEHGYVYYDKGKFHAGFAADVSADEAAFMYASQQPIKGAGFVETITKAAWRTKPSYGIVATEDKSINPDIERNLYKRSGTTITEINGSHVVFMTHPEEVAAVILTAAEN